MSINNEVFIFGTQYYRAPTPEFESWEKDFAKMRKLGFNSVKFWIQWRWSHRAEEKFYFADIDKLMDLAYENELKVTLNVIFDVAPIWLYKKFPNAKMVTLDGEVLEPRSAGHRQIGGFPGPCYNHDGAMRMRLAFLEEIVKRYVNHPALDMWDVWNEPEQCGVYREPKYGKLTCYCDACRKKFKAAMKEKYESIDILNMVWGRCYSSFDEVEIPYDGSTYVDFIDYREFMLDTLTKEAERRFQVVRKFDKKHKVYLHVVPNTSAIFNSLTGVDDFALAQKCDVFGSTNFASPIWSILTVSAAKEKVSYNVECHIGSGTTAMHQRKIEYKDLVNDLVPQIGMGLRGFMFWQYRPEILGIESPAWGVTALNGSEASIFNASKKFIEHLNPLYDEIIKSQIDKPQIAIWKGRKNEIFNFCMKGDLEAYSKTYESYVNAIYYSNYNCKIVDDDMVMNNELDGIKLLILPQCYAITEEFAQAIVNLLNVGISILCEAHLGGYNLSSGRHSLEMPGCGLGKEFGMKEEYTTASYHLGSSEYTNEADFEAMPDDVKKAIQAYGLKGGKYYPIRIADKYLISGAERFASLTGENLCEIGKFGDDVCIASKIVGKGRLYYCGTNIAEGSEMDQDGFVKFLTDVLKKEEIIPNMFDNTPYGVHIDVINDNLICINNTTSFDYTLTLDRVGKGLFHGEKTNTYGKFIVSAKTAEIIRLES